MSSSITVTIATGLRRDMPTWVLEYLQGLAADPPVEAVPELPSDHEWISDFGTLPDGGWFNPPFADFQLIDQAQSWDVRVSGVFHESCNNWLYAFLHLMARWSRDGCIGCSWTNNGSAGANTWFASTGELFAGGGGGRPFALTNDRTLLPLPGHLYEVPDERELRAYGLSGERATAIAQGRNDDPALARWLLARRLWRTAVEEADYAALGADATPQAVAGLAVEHVLRALDEGKDETALADAPGWQITERKTARGSGQWQREIVGLAEHAGDLSSEAAATAPLRLEVGMRLRTVAPMAMVARSSEMTQNHGGRGSSWHQLDVMVPVGAELTVVQVWSAGHAAASSTEWPSWIATEQRGTYPDEPAVPRSPADTYTLRMIHPLDEGELWALEE